MKSLFCFLLLVPIFSCNTAPQRQAASDLGREDYIQENGSSVKTRFLLPAGYERIAANPFGEYLRELQLKPVGTEVKLYNGEVKPNANIYEAVVDLPIGNKNLHQCGDAIMRLRADYLWKKKAYDSIHFNFTSGFRVDYSEWMKGKRVVLKGNQASWVEAKKAGNTYEDFWAYLELIFTYSGTLSLEKELKSVEMKNLQVGDIFIQGGSPGHAVIVVDAALHPKTKEKIFLLAQSYMPAQEIQILQNPENALSPWYSVQTHTTLKTPEWTFEPSNLKRFP